jgi:hypothetical protein
MLSSKIPAVLFLNPWERRVGPNRYLLEMLRNAPELARKATVIFHEPTDSLEEYQRLGCKVAVWEDTALIRAGKNWRNLSSLFKRHSLGLGRVLRRIMATRRTDSSNTDTFLGDMASVFGILI